MTRGAFVRIANIAKMHTGPAVQIVGGVPKFNSTGLGLAAEPRVSARAALSIPCGASSGDVYAIALRPRFPLAAGRVAPCP